jgi:hypothetical protein
LIGCWRCSDAVCRSTQPESRSRWGAHGNFSPFSHLAAEKTRLKSWALCRETTGALLFFYRRARRIRIMHRTLQELSPRQPENACVRANHVVFFLQKNRAPPIMLSRSQNVVTDRGGGEEEAGSWPFAVAHIMANSAGRARFKSRTP